MQLTNAHRVKSFFLAMSISINYSNKKKEHRTHDLTQILVEKYPNT